MENFVIHTDHSSLRLLMEINDRSGGLMRWLLRLSEFGFQVVYKKGYLNTQADALSRLATLGETFITTDDDIPCYQVPDVGAAPAPSASGHIGSPGSAWCAHDDLLSLKYDAFERVLTTDLPRPSEDLLHCVTTEVLLCAQLGDEFCTQIRSRPNGGGVAVYDKRG